MIAEVRAKGEPVKDEALELGRAAGGRRRLNGAAPCFTFRAGSRLAILADDVARLPVRGAEFLPGKDVSRAGRNGRSAIIVLGLDLQGGSHILLEVDANAVRKEKIEALRDDVRRVVRDNRLGSPAAVAIRGNTVEFRIREGGDPQLALHEVARIVAAARRPDGRDRRSARSMSSMPATACSA